jgi:hypothetical protein
VELTLFFVVHAFAMLNTVTNPILYGWLNTNLKHLFRFVLESRAEFKTLFVLTYEWAH